MSDAAECPIPGERLVIRATAAALRIVAIWSSTLAVGAICGCGGSSDAAAGSDAGHGSDAAPSDGGDASGGGGSSSDGSARIHDAGDDDGAPDSGGDSGVTANDDASLVSDGNPDIYASCTWTLGSGSPQGKPPTHNNSADLSGAPLGTLAFDATQQRRTVPVTATTSLPGLTLGQAYLTRVTATDEAAFLTLSVTNSGANYSPCFVRASMYQWLGATGQTLNSATDAYIDGSVGTVPGPTDTDTCLAPGETGYFTEIEIPSSGPLYSAVTSIVIGLTSPVTANPPAATLLPTRYDVGTCASNRALRVEGTASGATVSVGTSGADLAPAVLFDAAGVVAGWTFFLQMQPSNVAPGAKAYFYDTTPEPSVSRAQVFLPFGPQDATLMTLPGYMLREMVAMRAARSERARHWQIALARAAVSLRR